MNKQLKLIVVLIIFAAAFFWLVDPAGWFKKDADSDADDPGRRVLCDLSADDITAFTITKADGVAFRLERDGDKWFVALKDRKVKARTERIDKLLADVPGLRSEALMSSKTEKHDDFEVGEETGIRLSMDTAGQTDAAVLVVGKAAPGYKGAFVRIGTGADVYRAEKNIKSHVGFSIDDYKTRTPWEFTPTMAEKVTITPEDGESLEFLKSASLWKKPGGGNANQNKLNELIDKFSKLQISNYADDATPEETGLEGAEPRLSVSGPFGQLDLMLGNNAESKYYVTDGSGSTYRISEFNMKFLTEADIDEIMLSDVEESAEGVSMDGAEADPAQ